MIATIGLVTLALTSTAARGSQEEPYLADDALTAAFADATLIGSNWAEYYAPDGVIVGKVRYLGMLHEFTGRWIAKRDQVCFEYKRSEHNTCSKFRLLEGQMRHFGADGKPKRDGISRRLQGNRLEEFR